jgi:hypothetical protein
MFVVFYTIHLCMCIYNFHICDSGTDPWNIYVYVCKVTNVYSCASEIRISELVMKFESTLTGSNSDTDQVSS